MGYFLLPYVLSMDRKVKPFVLALAIVSRGPERTRTLLEKNRVLILLSDAEGLGHA